MQSSPSSSAPVTPVRGYIAFDGAHRLASGALAAVAVSVADALRSGAQGPILVFDDSTSELIDLDTRGTNDQIVARLALLPVPDDTGHIVPLTPHSTPAEPPEPRGRGRPKLGVVAREVTLLPRHWGWLATQSGGASVALRKLVDEARRSQAEHDERRLRHERAYRFISAMAGNQAGFEEATRALFADDRGRFKENSSAWPIDIRKHALQLAFGANEQPA